jgi:hypothetical protein
MTKVVHESLAEFIFGRETYMTRKVTKAIIGSKDVSEIGLRTLQDMRVFFMGRYTRIAIVALMCKVNSAQPFLTDYGLIRKMEAWMTMREVAGLVGFVESLAKEGVRFDYLVDAFTALKLLGASSGDIFKTLGRLVGKDVQ